MWWRGPEIFLLGAVCWAMLAPAHFVVADNVLAQVDQTYLKCKGAVIAALNKPCAVEARGASRKAAQLWQHMEAAKDAQELKIRQGEYVDFLGTPLKSVCRAECGREFRDTDIEIDKACNVAAFGAKEGLEVEKPGVLAAMLQATMLRSWQTACMLDPSSGYPCAQAAARRVSTSAHVRDYNITAFLPAPPFAFADIPSIFQDGKGAQERVYHGNFANSGARYAFHEKEMQVVKLAKNEGSSTAAQLPHLHICGACYVAGTQMRMIQNRIIGDRLSNWKTVKNVYDLPSGDESSNRIKCDLNNDRTHVSVIEGTCGKTDPIKLDVNAREPTMFSVDPDTMVLTIPPVTAYDHTGLNGFAIFAVVLVGSIVIIVVVYFGLRYRRLGRYAFDKHMLRHDLSKTFSKFRNVFRRGPAKFR